MNENRPVSLRHIVYADKRNKDVKVVREEYGIVFDSHERAELFIQERKKYWESVLNMELKLSPMQNETIEEIEIQKIFKFVAKAMGKNPKFILRKTRDGDIIRVRRYAIAICRDLGLSTPTIGKAIGQDHSNIVYHDRKFHEFCEVEPGYEDKYNEIKDSVLVKLNGKFAEDGSGKKIKDEA